MNPRVADAKDPVAKKAPRMDTVWAANDLKWEPGPAPGSHIAKLWGDWEKGAFGVLVKFDAGTVNALHSHSHDLKIVVISGTFVHTPEGGKEVSLPAGSYLRQVGKRNHISGCGGGEACEFFLSSDFAFDMIPAAKK
jgi:hypothetical protein